VLHLAQVGCTAGEIAAALNVPEELLHRRFERQLRQGEALFRGRLRALLLESAAAGKIPAQLVLCRLHLREEEGGAARPETLSDEELANMTMSQMVDAFIEQQRGGRGTRNAAT